MIDVGQDRRRLRVFHDRADLALDEIRRRVVRCLADHHVLECRPKLQAAALPGRLVDLLALRGRGFHRQALFYAERHAVQRFMGKRPDLARLLLDVLAKLLRQGAVAGRHRVVRRALEHRQMRGCLAITGAA